MGDRISCSRSSYLYPTDGCLAKQEFTARHDFWPNRGNVDAFYPEDGGERPGKLVWRAQQVLYRSIPFL